MKRSEINAATNGLLCSVVLNLGIFKYTTYNSLSFLTNGHLGSGGGGGDIFLPLLLETQTRMPEDNNFEQFEEMCETGNIYVLYCGIGAEKNSGYSLESLFCSILTNLKFLSSTIVWRIRKRATSGEL